MLKKRLMMTFVVVAEWNLTGECLGVNFVFFCGGKRRGWNNVEVKFGFYFSTIPFRFRRAKVFFNEKRKFKRRRNELFFVIEKEKTAVGGV